MTCFDSASTLSSLVRELLADYLAGIGALSLACGCIQTEGE
jgi:hypothetical protein